MTETATTNGIDLESLSSEQMIQLTLKLFCGSHTEIRCLGVSGRKNRTDSGYFKDFRRAAKACEQYTQDKSTKGVYFVLNRFSENLIARATNRIEQYAESTTADKDITRRRWLLVDFDSVRPTGISATAAELETTRARALDAIDWLKSMGTAEPIFALSGNGFHVLLPIDLPNDDESLAIVRGVLKAVADRFEDDAVSVDQTVSNAARICRLYGTIARKGDDIPERPHRMARLVHVPDYLLQQTGEVCDPRALQAIASLAGDVQPQQKSQQRTDEQRFLHHGQPKLKVNDYLMDHGYRFKLDQKREFTNYVLEECPFNSDHKSPDSMVTQGSDGGVQFKCLHNSCAGNRWEQLKALLPPSADHYDPPLNRTGAPKNAPLVGESRVKHGKETSIADKSRQTKKICDEFKPFPSTTLPEPLSTFCQEVSRAVGCDESFPAMVVLAVCSSAIGTSRQLCIKYGWFVPPIIWTLLIGESGTQKTPPFRMAMGPLKEKQQRDVDFFTSESAQYQTDLKAYKREHKQWLKNQEGDEPEEPSQPIRKRCIVQDATIEALAPILNENPRGVLLARDELSGWLAGFDKYSNKATASSEVPKWLEIYNAESITIDRKTGDERFLFVRRPFVSICGGIQPGILAKCLTEEHKESGLQSRLLMTFPPRQPKEWRDDELSQSTQLKYSDCIRGLFSLQPEEDSKPATLSLSPEARELFKSYVNKTGQEQAALHGHLASQWSKLEEIPARLAIIIHSVRQVTTGVEDHWSIDADTMQAAIDLGEWFKDETLRINRVLTIPEYERAVLQLVSWIQSQGGSITARDLAKARRDITSSEEAEEKLIELVERRFGEWRGIHKSRAFFLFDQNLSAIDTQIP